MENSNQGGVTVNNHIKISIFVSICGLVTNLIFRLLRFGLSDNPPSESFKILGILFFLIFFPVLMPQWTTRRNRYLHHPASCFLLVLLVFNLIGFVYRYIPALSLVWVFAAAGVILFIYYLLRLFSFAGKYTLLIGLPLLLIFAMDNGSFLYGNLIRPHFFEGLVVGIIPHNWRLDTFFQSSIAQMLNSYGVPSTGVEGLPWIKYHFGSHAIYALTANFMEMNILQFYIAAGPVIFGSAFFYIFFLLISQVRQYLYRSELEMPLGIVFWVLFIGAYTGFLPHGYIWKNKLESMIIATASNVGMVSESFLISMILALAAISMLFWQACNRLVILKSSFFFFVALPTLVLLITLTKISTGFIFITLVVYLHIRLMLIKNRVLN